MDLFFQFHAVFGKKNGQNNQWWIYIVNFGRPPSLPSRPKFFLGNPGCDTDIYISPTLKSPPFVM